MEGILCSHKSDAFHLFHIRSAVTHFPRADIQAFALVYRLISAFNLPAYYCRLLLFLPKGVPS